MQVDLRQYINELMVSTGGCASSGFPIASCKIYPDKSYAFLEFRSVEEASNCMAFDGVAYKDSYLRVRLMTWQCSRGGDQIHLLRRLRMARPATKKCTVRCALSSDTLALHSGHPLSQRS